MFSFLKSGIGSLNMRRIGEHYAVMGQIAPAQIPSIAQAGFKSILCARPDGEDHGQPKFDEIAAAAKAAGIEIVHIPVSGMLGEGQIIRFHEAWEKMPKPMLAYCRSGGRASALYQTLSR
ncbi:TIGR01244 family sulfur transferase [Pelagibacterium limicola]|uniref:TIGR01244 family sulfur transferase n=1 Tax=Pelagibacterium limicola TaxID=2791022 RepID=UPI0018AF6555|nr:TIGR01244 family sulfur transferase [Pelagibacterium limicola]